MMLAFELKVKIATKVNLFFNQNLQLYLGKTIANYSEGFDDCLTNRDSPSLNNKKANL